MLIALKDKRFESSLIEMALARAESMHMPPLSVREREPPHESGESSITKRPQHQVPVIRHHAIGEDPHGDTFLCLLQHAFKGRIVRILLEELAAAVGSIQDVVHQFARGYA
jgi:hypothetical protein